MYSVHTKKSKKPLLKTSDLRGADHFANQGRDRRVFNAEGQEMTPGGVTGITLAEFKGEIER